MPYWIRCFEFGLGLSCVINDVKTALEILILSLFNFIRFFLIISEYRVATRRFKNAQLRFNLLELEYIISWCGLSFE